MDDMKIIRMTNLMKNARNTEIRHKLVEKLKPRTGCGDTGRRITHKSITLQISMKRNVPAKIQLHGLFSYEDCF